jgi:hypothetical protein
MASARLGRLSHHLPSLAVAFFVARDDDDDSRARSTFLSSVRCEAPPKKTSDGMEKKKEEEGLVSRRCREREAQTMSMLVVPVEFL